MRRHNDTYDTLCDTHITRPYRRLDCDDLHIKIFPTLKCRSSHRNLLYDCVMVSQCVSYVSGDGPLNTQMGEWPNQFWGDFHYKSKKTKYWDDSEYKLGQTIGPSFQHNTTWSDPANSQANYGRNDWAHGPWHWRLMNSLRARKDDSDESDKTPLLAASTIIWRILWRNCWFDEILSSFFDKF